MLLKSLQPILAWLYRIYTSKKRSYTYKGITVRVYPGVFHPRFTFSTKFFVDFILGLQLEGRRVLELGCGSGLISLHAAAHGAEVTASDINPEALKSVSEGAQINQLKIRTMLSDLFEHLDPGSFDLVFINPPYYPKKPDNLSEGAWFCGEDFEYFRQLFQQLQPATGKAFMILSEDCQLETIEQIASAQGYRLEIVAKRKTFGEFNWIFSLTKNQAQNPTFHVQTPEP